MEVRRFNLPRHPYGDGFGGWVSEQGEKTGWVEGLDMEMDKNLFDGLPRGPKPPDPVKFTDFTPEELAGFDEGFREHLDWVVWMFALDTKPEAVKYARYLLGGE